MGGNKVILRRRTSGITLDNLPRYVKMVNKPSCLRLIDDDYELEYYVDGGQWGVYFEIRDGKLYSKSNVGSVDNCELVETTKEIWMKANEGYC